jgi:hypothetical protein
MVGFYLNLKAQTKRHFLDVSMQGSAFSPVHGLAGFESRGITAAVNRGVLGPADSR